MTSTVIERMTQENRGEISDLTSKEYKLNNHNRNWFMKHPLLNDHKERSIVHSRVMKTMQCAHSPHHHNVFVPPYLLLTASSGVHAFAGHYFLANLRKRFYPKQFLRFLFYEKKTPGSRYSSKVLFNTDSGLHCLICHSFLNSHCFFFLKKRIR